MIPPLFRIPRCPGQNPQNLAILDSEVLLRIEINTGISYHPSVLATASILFTIGPVREPKKTFRSVSFHESNSHLNESLLVLTAFQYANLLLTTRVDLLKTTRTLLTISKLELWFLKASSAIAFLGSLVVLRCPLTFLIYTLEIVSLTAVRKMLRW